LVVHAHLITNIDVALHVQQIAELDLDIYYRCQDSTQAQISAVAGHTIEREPNFGCPDPLCSNEYGQRTVTWPNGSSSLAAIELQRPAAQSVLILVTGIL
jgi:hypothetical protein